MNEQILALKQITINLSSISHSIDYARSIIGLAGCLIGLACCSIALVLIVRAKSPN